MVIWITGLAGTGKSTIARHLVERLRDEDHACLFIDGEGIGEVVAAPEAPKDRETQIQDAMRTCRFAQTVESQGLITVVATMSLFHAVHDWNRSHFANYLEVFVDVDPDALRQRVGGDLRGAGAGEPDHVIGVHLAPEIPTSPDLVLDNGGSKDDVAVLVGEIIEAMPSLQSE